MKKSTTTIAGSIIVALGVLIALTPRFLFPVCEFKGIFMQLGMGKTAHMPCYYTTMGAYILGVLIALIGLMVLMAKGRETVRMLAVVLGGASLAVTFLTVIFPICPNPDEPCNHGTKPLLIVLGIAALAVAGWLFFSSRKSLASMSTPAEPEV